MSFVAILRANKCYKQQVGNGQKINELYEKLHEEANKSKDLLAREKSINAELEVANTTIEELQSRLHEAKATTDRATKAQQLSTETDIQTLKREHQTEIQKLHTKARAAYQHTQVEAKLNEDIQARDGQLKEKSDQLRDLQTQLNQIQDDYATLNRQHNNKTNEISRLEEDVRTLESKLKDIESDKEALEARLRVTLTHLRLLVFDHSPKVNVQAFEHFAGVDAESESFEDNFQTRYGNAVTKKAWSWTLSMVSESDTRPYLGHTFSQLTVRLCLMMSSLKNEDHKFFVVIEAMLQWMEACRLENISQLASSLEVYLTSSEQIDSELKMLAVARVIELIHRAADSLELHWHGFAAMYALWKSKIPQDGLCSLHLLNRAYFAWFSAYEKAVLLGDGDFALTLPELWMLIGDTDEFGIENTCYDLLHSTDEVLLRGQPGKPRRLFADSIAFANDDYAIVDLDKQSIFVYRQTEGAHNIGKVVLTVTKRLNGHGEFEEVAPFMMTYVDIRFVNRHMPGVFKRALLRAIAMDKSWEA